MTEAGKRDGRVRQRSIDDELTCLSAQLAGLRVEFALLRLYRLETKRRYPAPHWDYQPRVPKGEAGGGRWTGGSATSGAATPRVHLVQARGRRSDLGLQIGRQFVPATLGQMTRFEIARLRADHAVEIARMLNPRYRSPEALYRTVEGAIGQQEARLQHAEQFVLSRQRRGIGDNGGPPLEPYLPRRGLIETLAPGGVVTGVRVGGAREHIRTITAEEMNEAILGLTHYGRQLTIQDSYEGVWYESVDKCVVGIRYSKDSGLTLDLSPRGPSELLNSLKFHQR